MTVDLEGHLVQMPLVTGLWPSATGLISEGLCELATSSSNGLAGEGDATHGPHLLNIAVAEIESEIGPDAVGDNFWRETMTVVEGVGFAHLFTVLEACPRWPLQST